MSGSAFHRERIALPRHATLLVELIDLAEPNAALGAATVAPAGQVPIDFGLVVDSSKRSEGEVYGIQARIAVDGSTWFASAGPIPVDPAKAGEPFSILLVQAGGKGAREASGVSLAGTGWRILELDGKSADPNVTSTLIFDADGAVSGNGGCNTFRGSVDIEGSTMTFGQLASTMMACEGVKSAQETLPCRALTDGVVFAPGWRADARRCGGQDRRTPRRTVRGGSLKLGGPMPRSSLRIRFRPQCAVADRAFAPLCAEPGFAAPR